MAEIPYCSCYTSVKGMNAMLYLEDIKIEVTCQGFESQGFAVNEERRQAVLLLRSNGTNIERCPWCGSIVHVYDSFQVNLKDAPIWHTVEQRVCVTGYRYRCTSCGKTFTEEIPFKYPGTRITCRAAEWIKAFLRAKISVRAIQNLTGIHWDTIRKVQKEYIDASLNARENQFREENYRPKLLAVDEFAIHKGHSYTTCVMDLESGEIIWVGKGRAKNDFLKFFEETDSSLLSAVMAVAMEMNASYNKLVEQYLPYAKIVYDRYHMQAQFGKEVLGVVRLEEARKHKAASTSILASIDKHAEKEAQIEAKALAKTEKSQYTELKRLRWSLLKNSSKLSDRGVERLKSILVDHADLAVCYAMKEEMIRLFELSDVQKAYSGWEQWFAAAKASGIPALVRFAELKEKRISGLAAHAPFQISTGKLEGFNNKIKVAKRIGYGYRNDDYFFSLIRFLSLPHVRFQSPNFP